MSTFDHVQPGQPLSGLSASGWNAAMDAARAHRQSGTLAGRRETFQATGPMVWVRNNSGAAVPAFGVLALGLPVIVPADNESEFQQGIMFEGGTPVVPDDWGQFAVLAEPVDAGKIGRAWVSGVCQAYLFVPSAHSKCRYADVAAGATGCLLVGSGGGAEILWKDNSISSGTPAEPASLAWGLVRLSTSPVERCCWARISGGDHDDGFTWVEQTLSSGGNWGDCPAGVGLNSTDHGVAYAANQYIVAEDLVDAVVRLRAVRLSASDAVEWRFEEVLPKADTEYKGIFAQDTGIGKPNRFGHDWARAHSGGDGE